MAEVRVRWEINGADDSALFAPNAEWADVREIIRQRRPDPRPAPENIHLKPFGAKDEDDEVDYGQELSDADAPKTSKAKPLQVTIDSVQAGTPASAAITELAEEVRGLRSDIAAMQREQQDSDWSRFEKTVNRDEAEQQQFKMAMAGFYDRWVGFVPEDASDSRHPWKLSCMLTGAGLPYKNVIAGHIYPSSSGGTGMDRYRLEMPDVMNPRNGLLVVKNIEEALADKRACFIWDVTQQELLFYVLDPKLRKMNVLGSDNIKALVDPNDPVKKLSFQDLHSRPLLHPDGHFPFRRLLAREARKSFKRAVSNKWITRDEAAFFKDYCDLSDKASIPGDAKLSEASHPND